MECSLNLKAVEARFIDHVKAAWEDRDIERILYTMPGGQRLCFVVDNHPVLREAGLYEKALLTAYTGPKTNFSDWSLDVIRFLFQRADRDRFRALGDTIPNQESFTLYRGVSGRISKRKIKGISWTDSPGKASWFAQRFELADPAVFMVTVPNESILCRHTERSEDEYLVLLPQEVKPCRLKEMPDPIKPDTED